MAYNVALVYLSASDSNTPSSLLHYTLIILHDPEAIYFNMTTVYVFPSACVLPQPVFPENVVHTLTEQSLHHSVVYQFFRTAVMVYSH